MKKIKSVDFFKIFLVALFCILSPTCTCEGGVPDGPKTNNGTPEIEIDEVSIDYSTCIELQSSRQFKLKVNSKTWDGELYYSTNRGKTWQDNAWNGEEIISGKRGKIYSICLRGSGNSVLCNSEESNWIINSSLNDIVLDGNMMALLDYQSPDTSNMAEGCFAYLFKGCAALKGFGDNFELSSNALTASCYKSMFEGCTSLTSAPELPAITLADDCYNSMFKDCSSLVIPPVLSAQVLKNNCYSYMFKGCSSLKVSAENNSNFKYPFLKYNSNEDDEIISMLDETSGPFKGEPEADKMYYVTYEPVGLALRAYPYEGSYENCIELRSSCMFKLKTNLQILSDGQSYYSTDRGRTWTEYEWGGETVITSGEVDGIYSICLRGENSKTCIATSQVISIEAQKNDIVLDGNIMALCDWRNPPDSTAGFAYFFKNCTALREFGEHFSLSMQTISPNCYESMFEGCTSLITPPALPATILDNNCYQSMFKGCTSLTSASELPATTLADDCYIFMFKDCTSLVTPPALPATALADDCYNSMFEGCTSLITPPSLPAQKLASRCYQSMFKGCTSLTSAPELPATALKNDCYTAMFKGCTSLTAAPALPATTLKESCYYSMFQGCSSLVVPPSLSASNLARECYAFMFDGCSSLMVSDTEGSGYSYPFLKFTDNGGYPERAGHMFDSTAGLFKSTPQKDIVYYTDREPAGGALNV